MCCGCYTRSPNISPENKMLCSLLSLSVSLLRLLLLLEWSNKLNPAMAESCNTARRKCNKLQMRRQLFHHLCCLAERIV